MTDLTLYRRLRGASSGARAVFPWPPKPRPPLPPFPQPVNYATTLPFAPPPGPDIAFYRNDFCGVRVPGMILKPWMAGYTLPNPGTPLVMDLDLANYRGEDDQITLFFQAKQKRGLTHCQFSLGHYRSEEHTSELQSP